MGSLPYQLAADLRDRLELERAVETGTYQGGTTRVLARMFPSVVTVELSDQYFERATIELGDLKNVATRHGTSPERLRELEPAPTLYWLDAHWSGLDTAGSDHPCPVLEEIAAIQPDPVDCLLIDDARLFATSRDPEQWPTLVQVIDALRRARPDAYVTVVHDLILSVPPQAKDLVDDFGTGHAEGVWAAAEEARLDGFELAVPHAPRSASSRARSLLGRLRRRLRGAPA